MSTEKPGGRIEDTPRRSFDDPYPTSLEAVRKEMDYWVKRQGEGEPGSIWETNLQNRLVHLRNLESRYREQVNSSLEIRPTFSNRAEESSGTPSPKNLSFSESALAALHKSRSLASESRRSVITSSCLLFGLAETATDRRKTPWFVRNAFSTPGDYDAAFRRFLEDADDFDEGGSIPGLLGKFSPNARAIVLGAAEISWRLNSDPSQVHTGICFPQYWSRRRRHHPLYRPWQGNA